MALAAFKFKYLSICFKFEWAFFNCYIIWSCIINLLTIVTESAGVDLMKRHSTSNAIILLCVLSGLIVLICMTLFMMLFLFSLLINSICHFTTNKIIIIKHKNNLQLRKDKIVRRILKFVFSCGDVILILEIIDLRRCLVRCVDCWVSDIGWSMSALF